MAFILPKKQLKPRFALAPAERDYLDCSHEHVIVDDRARTLLCEDCQANVDPITYLHDLAIERRSLHFRFEQWEEMRADLKGQDFDKEWKKQAAAIDREPTTDPEKAIWFDFGQYFGAKKFTMRKTRQAAGGWYGSPVGSLSRISIEFARACVAKGSQSNNGLLSQTKDLLSRKADPGKVQ